MNENLHDKKIMEALDVDMNTSISELDLAIKNFHWRSENNAHHFRICMGVRAFCVCNNIVQLQSIYECAYMLLSLIIFHFVNM